WPTLSASYSKSLRGRSYFPGEPFWSAAGVLSRPLFGGGPTALSHGISAAGRDLERSEQGLRAARAQVQSALEAAWAGLAQNLDQLKVRELFLEAALQRDEEASVRYSSGLMTFENWELVVADLVDSERGVVRSRRDAMLAEAQWDRAAGLSLEE
ncbi:MAG: TolC family protein, partial [Elusimicrobiota bacterium]